MAAQTETRRIIVKVDTKDSKALEEVAAKLGMLNKTTKSMAGNFSMLSNAFRGWVGFLGVREITRMSDEMQNMFNRLKLITGSVEGAQGALLGLNEVADRTNQGLGNIGEVFNRLALSVKGSGANTKELLALTETLVNSFRVAGATTTETTNTIIQLSQAFSSGQLRGQELRSVMEQNATLAGLLKQRFGSDIYKKAEQGAISISAVLEVLAKNQKQINEDASKLAPTFEQTLVKSMNKVSLAIGELNKKFELSAKFASFMDFAVNHLTELVTVAGGVFTVFAATKIPAVIASMKELRVAFLAFASSNPILLIATGLATAGALIYENWDKLRPLFDKIKLVFLEFSYDAEEAIFSLQSRMASFLGTTLKPEYVIEHVNSLQSLRKEIEATKKAIATPAEAAKPAENTVQKDLETFIKKIKLLENNVKKPKELMAELNEEFSKGRLTIQQYAEKLDKVEFEKARQQFKEGKIDVLKFHEALRNIDLKKLNEDFDKGAISLSQYKADTAAARLKLLNEQLDAGRISLSQYNAEVLKLEDKFKPGAGFYNGVENFINSVGTLSEGVSRVTSQAFNHLSNTLSDFILKGKLDFKSFANAVLADITNMVVRASIVRPIAQGIMSLGTAFSGAITPAAATTLPASLESSVAYAANGGVMSSRGMLPLNKYASGGIADSPQMAIFGEGRRPEAYVPLPDGRNIPVKMDGGGGINFSQTIIINGDGTSSVSTKGTDMKGFAETMKRVALDTIIQQQRPGGALARG